MVGRLFFGLLAVVGSPLASAAGASAATVTVRAVSIDPGYGREPAVDYVAGPGERNDVLVVAVAGDRGVRITDPGAIITATGRCGSVDAHTAICHGDLLAARVELGDLDDFATTSRRWGRGVELSADGGPGNDVLEGGSGYADVVLNGGDGNDWLDAHGAMAKLHGGDADDRLNGSPEYDTLDGGSGADRLYGRGGDDDLDGGGGLDLLVGGPGADRLTDGDRDGAAADAAPGPDTLVGGRGGGVVSSLGGDTLSYQQRTQPVRVHAGKDRRAGEAGERDSISGIESIIGGDGDDRLVGDQRGNYLHGRGGADIVIGGGSADELWGGRGDDRLRADGGRDSLAGGAGIDALSCGIGSDLVIAKAPRAHEIVRDSCEELSIRWDHGARSQWLRPHLARPRPWWLRLRAACPVIWDDAYVECRGTLSVRESDDRHRLLAIGHFRHGADGATFAVPLALTRLGWRWRAGRLGKTPATVTLRMIAEHTPRRPFEWLIRR